MLYKRPLSGPKNYGSSQTYTALVKLSCVLIILFLFLSTMSSAQRRVIDSSRNHLRNGSSPEWDEFANSDPKKELVVFFNVSTSGQHTLSITQYDVKQNWNVFANGNKVGSLVVDGNAMKTYFKLLPEFLTTGENRLAIQPASSVVDDIIISEIAVDNRPLETVLSEATVNIEVFEQKTNNLVPARITIVDKKRILQSTGTKVKNDVAVRPGFVYTGSGKVKISLPQGDYIVYAGRGFEYSVDSTAISINPGEHLTRRLILHREVKTDGWVSCDTHIHTLTHSGHGDATERERAVTIAGEGIELPVITEHNKIVDFSSTVRDMRLDSTFISVAGDELTTPIGHFNIFPFGINDTAPTHQLNNWREFAHFSSADSQVIILNHGRDIHNDFRPFDRTRHVSIAGLRLDGWRVPANAMEIVNSGALQDEPMRLLHDWFGLLNRGYRITPVGASDSHDVSRYLVGQARTYIKVNHDNPKKTDVPDALRNLRRGKVMVSFGLITKATVNKKYGPGDEALFSRDMEIDIEVAGPAWINAERVTVYANGIKIWEQQIKSGKTPGVKWTAHWKLPRQKQDMYLVAVAQGSGEYLPYWPIVKPFQPISTSWKPYTIGSSGAIWIDGDGDGKISCAYDYAKRLIDRFEKDYSGLVRALSKFDEAVCVQAAASLYEAGVDLTSSSIAIPLSKATHNTREGFRKFVDALKASDDHKGR